ncbi:hypothetical protein HYH03_001324 [Edaphochlamys debaryana]|uniref:Uncharacterized protein n=1 Tax=Edaphochlamys debaryana TaxID=47281 RepID=A0A835YCV1_9CHLO|nr:hypothetical protein HYH03_001324 [Edaphochlamys debaryana]|eukprot:KAG2500550.1 hypothetical protein HYH03_001324 [Edaphochlamys debaryana]
MSPALMLRRGLGLSPASTSRGAPREALHAPSAPRRVPAPPSRLRLPPPTRAASNSAALPPTSPDATPRGREWYKRLFDFYLLAWMGHQVWARAVAPNWSYLAANVSLMDVLCIATMVASSLWMLHQKRQELQKRTTTFCTRVWLEAAVPWPKLERDVSTLLEGTSELLEGQKRLLEGPKGLLEGTSKLLEGQKRLLEGPKGLLRGQARISAILEEAIARQRDDIAALKRGLAQRDAHMRGAGGR